MKFKKAINKHGDRILITFSAIILFLFVSYLIYLGVIMLTPESSPHPVLSNQSVTKNVQGGKYRNFTQNYLKYSFDYPAEYKVVENQPDFIDGINKRTHVYMYDAVVGFQYYTNQSLEQEIESIKKGNNNQVTVKEIDFKGIKSLEVTYQNYPEVKKIFVPKGTDFLMIESYHDQKTSEDWVRQYEADFQSMITSFKFLGK